MSSARLNAKDEKEIEGDFNNLKKKKKGKMRKLRIMTVEEEC